MYTLTAVPAGKTYETLAAPPLTAPVVVVPTGVAPLSSVKLTVPTFTLFPPLVTVAVSVTFCALALKVACAFAAVVVVAPLATENSVLEALTETGTAAPAAVSVNAAASASLVAVDGKTRLLKLAAPLENAAASVDEGDVNWLCTSAMLTLPPLYVTVWLFSVSDTTGAGEIAVPTYPVAGSAGGLVVKLSA